VFWVAFCVTFWLHCVLRLTPCGLVPTNVTGVGLLGVFWGVFFRISSFFPRVCKCKGVCANAVSSLRGNSFPWCGFWRSRITGPIFFFPPSPDHPVPRVTPSCSPTVPPGHPQPLNVALSVNSWPGLKTYFSRYVVRTRFHHPPLTSPPRFFIVFVPPQVTFLFLS